MDKLLGWRTFWRALILRVTYLQAATVAVILQSRLIDIEANTDLWLWTQWRSWFHRQPCVRSRHTYIHQHQRGSDAQISPSDFARRSIYTCEARKQTVSATNKIHELGVFRKVTVLQRIDLLFQMSLYQSLGGTWWAQPICHKQWRIQDLQTGGKVERRRREYWGSEGAEEGRVWARGFPLLTGGGI